MDTASLERHLRHARPCLFRADDLRSSPEPLLPCTLIRCSTSHEEQHLRLPVSLQFIVKASISHQLQLCRLGHHLIHLSLDGQLWQRPPIQSLSQDMVRGPLLFRRSLRLTEQLRAQFHEAATFLTQAHSVVRRLLLPLSCLLLPPQGGVASSFGHSQSALPLLHRQGITVLWIQCPTTEGATSRHQLLERSDLPHLPTNRAADPRRAPRQHQATVFDHHQQ